MSFSVDVKNEIVNLQSETDQNQLAILAALIKINGTLSISSGKMQITIKTENELTAQFIIDLIVNQFKCQPRVSYFRNSNLKKNPYFIITIKDNPLSVLKSLDIFDDQMVLNAYPSKKIVNDSMTLSCYFRGAFLASGSINHPESTGGYHLEISCNDLDFAKYLAHLLAKKYIYAKVCSRRNKFIVYLKKGETIADFLKLIGVTDNLLIYEHLRIERDYENNYNRASNCFLANELKRRKIADHQLSIIEKLVKNNKISFLNEKEKIIVKLRQEDPDATLSEIAQKYSEIVGKNISKSTVRSVFLRLEEEVEKDD